MLNKLFEFFSPKEKRDIVFITGPISKEIKKLWVSENDEFIENLDDFTSFFTTHYLEETTNTHKLKASKITVVKEIGSTQVLKLDGKGLIFHGEHGIIKTESPYIIKYVQQEFNPVSRIIENAYD